MRSNGENTLATQVPYKAAPNIEQLAGAPADFRRFLSEAVEEAPPIVQRAQPIGFRHAAGPLAIQSRPSVEIDSGNAISGKARALFDFRDRLPATTATLVRSTLFCSKVAVVAGRRWFAAARTSRMIESISNNCRALTVLPQPSAPTSRRVRRPAW